MHQDCMPCDRSELRHVSLKSENQATCFLMDGTTPRWYFCLSYKQNSSVITICFMALSQNCCASEQEFSMLRIAVKNLYLLL